MVLLNSYNFGGSDQPTKTKNYLKEVNHMIKVVTSPEYYGIGENEKEVRCFLAGGITGCPDWQSKVIEELIRLDEEDQGCKDKIAKDYTLVLFNPRRENFPIDDPTAARNQITWEFDNLETSDIFSMYFCAGESDQPICMYELGRNVAQFSGIYDNPLDYICIAVENGYKRKQDVDIQMELALGEAYQENNIENSADFIKYGDAGELELTHAFEIFCAFKQIVLHDFMGISFDD